MKRWFWLLVLGGLWLGLLPLQAAGLIVVDEAYWHPPGRRPPVFPPPWPHPVPRPFAPLEVVRHQADVSISDQVATVSVVQEFRNPNPQRMEGTFLLPVPKGAQLKKFSMEINGRSAEAELLAAEKARGIYEDIVRRLKDPALLEYAGQDVYKVRIFPIEPHETKRIALSYTQLLPEDNDVVSFVYPLSTEKYSAKPIPNFSLRLTLASQRPLKSIYSPSHTVEIRRDGPRRATVGLEQAAARPEGDFQLFFTRETGEVGLHLMTHATEAGGGFFLLLMSPGQEPDDRRVSPKDVAFVLDTSGSMAGPKLEQAKRALAFCVDNLNDQDRFEIIRFATDTEALFDRLAEATSEHRRRAQGFIEELKPIGGTAIDDALRRALALRPGDASRPFVVIFLTDGLPTVGTTDEAQILANVRKAGPGDTRVFCFGIGHDVNTHLLDKITEQTRAASTYVLPQEDLEIKVSNFYRRIKDPVWVNPTVKFTGNVRATQLYPNPLPDLFRGDQMVIVGRYAGEGPSAVVLEGLSGGKPRTLSHDVRFPAGEAEHDFIPRLWATRRVGYLLDAMRLQGENPELRDEVIDLARRYGVVTPYTAYLIVEDESRRGVPMSMQSLPQIQQDSTMRDSLSEGNTALLRQRYGLAPVSRARSEQALKQAAAPSAAVAASSAEAGRAVPAAVAPLGPSVGGAPAGSAPQSAAAAASGGQTTRFVGGQTFFFQGEQWVDARVQQQKQPRLVKVVLASPEYFALLRKAPQIREWLALGPRVQFVLDGTVYTVEP